VRRGAIALLAATALVQAGPAAAQSFFERLFRPPPPQAVPPQPQYSPQQPPYVPQQPREAPAQPRRTQKPSQPQPQQAAKPEQPHAETPAEPPPPPYEKDVLRLAEIIGSLAFLRSLCSTPDAQEWPKRMQILLDAEGTTPGRKERLAGAYNKGYQAFSLTYRVCTPSATEATNRYVKEGDLLSRNLAGRYGG
jgi:uncharacterized protein (TIGR02301 family)